MHRAVNCLRCETDRMLRWKHWDCELWWIVCEGCGYGGTPGHTQAEGGENWNRENAITINTRLVGAREDCPECNGTGEVISGYDPWNGYPCHTACNCYRTYEDVKTAAKTEALQHRKQSPVDFIKMAEEKQFVEIGFRGKNFLRASK